MINGNELKIGCLYKETHYIKGVKEPPFEYLFIINLFESIDLKKATVITFGTEADNVLIAKDFLPYISNRTLFHTKIYKKISFDDIFINDIVKRVTIREMFRL